MIPVFGILSQSTIWVVEPTTDQVPIICPVVCVFATNKIPLNVSVLVVPLTVTMTERNNLLRKRILLFSQTYWE